MNVWATTDCHRRELEVSLWQVCRPDLVTPVTRRLRNPLGRIVGISDKWSGKLPRYHLPGDLLFAFCGACRIERKCRHRCQDLLWPRATRFRYWTVVHLRDDADRRLGIGL